MREIDLHVHTHASDGTELPRKTVEIAKRNGLRAIAITDHDTVLGCKEAMEAGQELGIEVVPGIEFGTKYGIAVHMLGYYMDLDSPVLTAMTRSIVEDRDNRNEKTVKLMQENGIDVTYPQLKERFGEVIGRPHFARILMEAGLVTDVEDAFSRYLGKNMKYHQYRHTLEIDEVIECIVNSGGIAVLAHPFQYKKNDAELRELIEHCMKFGLKGMECRYSGYTNERVEYLERLAEEYSLVKTGGSDFHGENKPHIGLGSGIDNNLEVPYEWLEKLKALKNT